jgi:paraquat-inducible protein B
MPEMPPVLTTGLPGREFVLRADELGSVDHGTPLYFRRLQVGEVVAYELDADGKALKVRVFVHAPYDRFVGAATRFWHASGIDVALDAGGLRINTESVAAILIGGIAFGTVPGEAPGAPAAASAEYRLHATRAAAFKRDDPREQRFLLVFRESVRGLEVGAPVDFRGIAVGEVASIQLATEAQQRQPVIAVELRFYPDRVLRVSRRGIDLFATPAAARAEFDRLVAAGFRAQLRSGNLLTGQLYVAFDLFPGAPKAQIDWNDSPPRIPTVPGDLPQLQAALASIATKLDRIPYEQIGAELRLALQALNRTLGDADLLMKQLGTEVAPELKATLVEARRTLSSAERTLAADSPLQQEARQALHEVARAAASVRALTEAIERQPDSLLRGRREDSTP